MSFRSIEIFDSILVDLTKEEGCKMERFLVCSRCSREGKECFFKDVGPAFQLHNDMELCLNLTGDIKGHPLEEKLKSLLATTKGPNAFSLTAFLKDGIENIPKMSFTDLRPDMQVGDQVWIYRDANTTSCNPVASIMPYAHVVVYVGNNEVVHVDKDRSCCAGILMGTIKRVPIEDVIEPNDQGRS